jgi:hypothetical protein
MDEECTRTNYIKLSSSRGNIPCEAFCRPQALNIPINFSKWGGNVEGLAPLMRRACVFQERLLAPRTLHFYNEELLLECRSSVACECGHINELLGHGGSSRTLKVMYNDVCNPSTSQNSAHDFWWDAIFNYSKLLITYENDRLPALSGFARQFSAVVRSDYLAGLWRSDLPRSLGWARRAQFGPHANPKSIRSSSTIPSWTWTSIKAEDKSRSETIYHAVLDESWKCIVDSRLKILEAYCIYNGVNKFGDVSSGLIRLEGAILKGEMFHSHEKEDWHRLSILDEETKVFIDVSCDQPHADKPEVVHCLIIGSSSVEAHEKVSTNNVHDFILVLRHKKWFEYQRVGLAEMKKPKGHLRMQMFVQSP